MIQKFLRPHHKWVLWLDADVVSYPPDLVSILAASLNRKLGVAAPLVVIEDSDTEEFHTKLCRRPLCHMGMQRATKLSVGTAFASRRYAQFYDRAAFIARGVNVSDNPAFPGSVSI